MVQNRDVNEDAFASNDVYNKGAMTLLLAEHNKQ
jgi:hypothetical protein